VTAAGAGDAAAIAIVTAPARIHFGRLTLTAGLNSPSDPKLRELVIALTIDNTELVRTYLEAVNRRDADGMIARATEDLEFVPIMAALEGHVYRGYDGVRRWLEDMDKYWETFQTEPIDYLDLGDRVLALGCWHAQGRASGVEINGQPATWLAWIRDGKIYKWRTFTDREEAFTIAGVDPDFIDTEC
jgi:ketosteroid isomerase-like protein